MSRGLIDANDSKLARRNAGRRAWALAIACLTLVLCLGSKPLAAEEPTDWFDIAAKPLADAIMEFGVQSGLLVVAPTALTAGKTANAVRGRMPAAEALRQLLKGSNLTFARGEGGTIIIQSSAPVEIARSTEFRTAFAEVLPSAAPDEIVVTATRRKESLSKVPIAVSAYDRVMMEAQGVKSVEAIAQLTPGLDFYKVNFPGNSKTRMSIRGISSDTGASTTGVYIDDTPIQNREVQDRFGPGYPYVFDLERVEVLRGPQGTLFGAGSEGGTVRFITPEPNLAQAEGYARTELATTSRGAPSYEAGAVLGVPLVDDRLGVRLSAWYRADGGYVDRVNALDGATIDADSNSGNVKVMRLALAFAPVERVKVTPALFYQDARTDDSSTFWEMLSDPASGLLRSGKVLAQPTRDRFLLSSLKVEADLAIASLTTVTSYYDRKSRALTDYTNYVQSLLIDDPFPRLPGQNASEQARSSQAVATQEMRLQSSDPVSRWTWVAGAFYSRNRQVSDRKIIDLYAPIYLLEATGRTLEEEFGSGPYLGLYLYTDRTETHDRQLAAYGDVSYRLTPQWSLTAGLRIADTKFDSVQANAGPVVAPHPVEARASAHEKPITPKLAISYQLGERLFYVSAAKGYRVGGGNVPVPQVQCADDLESLGIDAAPTSFDSDSVWSYELGAKVRALDGRLRADASVFHVDWSGIQSGITLACGFFFTSNFGKASSEGFDLALSVEPLRGLELALAASYLDARYDTTVGTGAQTVVTEGDTLGLTPWTVRFSPEFSFRMLGREAFVRADYVYRSHNSGRPVKHDPAIPATYNPTIPLDPATHLLNVRAGLSFASGLSAALFVDNALDKAPLLQRWHDSPQTGLYTDNTFRPRTYGVTATYRF